MLDDAARRLKAGLPMLTLRLGRVFGDLLQKFSRLGYVRASDYAFEELGIGERTMQNYARLAEGIRGRPVLRAAFLAGRLDMSHALLLLHLPAKEDAEWVSRADGMGIRELRAALKSRVHESVTQEHEEMAVLELDLNPEPFVDWLNTRELACRREGCDLPAGSVMERIVSAFLAAAPLPAQEPGPFFLPEREPTKPPARKGHPEGCACCCADTGEPQAPEPTAPPAPKRHAQSCACCRSAAPESTDGEPAENLPAELTCLLPHDPRKLAVLARELMRAREASELLLSLILERIQRVRLFREMGQRLIRPAPPDK